MTRTHWTPRATGMVGGVALLLGALTGCTSGEAPEDPARAQQTDQATVVLQPGKPGEPASPGSPEGPATESAWNHADVAFAQMMIPHHAQALAMAELAPDRAASPQVRALAERISAAQAPEIMTLAAWLDDRDMEVPRAHEQAGAWDHAQHGHDGMAGMLTQAEMDRLATSEGRRFDRLFLQGMIAHHRGALEMAGDVAVTGADLRISEMAADISAGQAAEIARMRGLLRGA